MEYMLCKNCKYFQKRECVLHKTSKGRRVLVDSSYYCPSFNGIKKGKLNILELVEKEKCCLTNRYGGFVKLDHINTKRFLEDNYDLKIIIMLGEELFLRDDSYEIDTINNILKQCGFEIEIVE